MNWSRILSVLSFIATILSFCATMLGQLDPQYAVWALAISATIQTFVERIQGGASKV